MADFHGQTVDIHEDFEDALGGDWTEVDPDTNVDVNSANANYAGTYGLEISVMGADSTPDSDCYVDYDSGAERADVSVGFWVHIPTHTTWTVATELFSWYDDTSVGWYNCKIYFQKSGTTYTMSLRGTGFSANSKTLPSMATWYWVTADLNRNSTCTLRVYDTGENEVDSGTAVTVTGGDHAADSFYVGWDGSTLDDVDYWWDDFVIDWTAQTFPLLGWSVAAGATVPVMVHHYKTAGGM